MKWSSPMRLRLPNSEYRPRLWLPTRRRTQLGCRCCRTRRAAISRATVRGPASGALTMGLLLSRPLEARHKLRRLQRRRECPCRPSRRRRRPPSCWRSLMTSWILTMMKTCLTTNRLHRRDGLALKNYTMRIVPTDSSSSSAHHRS